MDGFDNASAAVHLSVARRRRKTALASTVFKVEGPKRRPALFFVAGARPSSPARRREADVGPGSRRELNAGDSIGGGRSARGLRGRRRRSEPPCFTGVARGPWCRKYGFVSALDAS